jgi:hypothetical protein
MDTLMHMATALSVMAASVMAAMGRMNVLTTLWNMGAPPGAVLIDRFFMLVSSVVLSRVILFDMISFTGHSPPFSFCQECCVHLTQLERSCPTKYSPQTAKNRQPGAKKALGNAITIRV